MRWLQADSLPCRYDPRGALVSIGIDGSTIHEYHYDAQDRLADYRSVTLATRSAFAPLNLSDGDWTTRSGTWSVNDNGTSGDTSDDYLEETTSAIAAILYHPADVPQNGFTFRYRSPHDPADPDGDDNPGEFRGDDYLPKYYAQVLLALDTTTGPPYTYAALRIEPDRLSVVYFDGATIHELDSVAAPTAVDTWYTVSMRIVFGGPNFATFSVERDSETAGEPAAVLAEGIPLGDLPSIDATAIGFTVGAHAGYQFQLKEYALDVDYADTFVSYAYDAYGRKISETNFGGADVGFVETAKTLFVYDGWRLLEEVSVDPSDNSTHVVADDVPGPAYVDDIVANRRDLDHSGSLASDEQFYHLTDQQYSTVALLAGDGNPAERYGYDPFGAPSLYNGSGDPEYDPHNTAELTTKSDFNPNLYTGQRYLPEAKLYDSRNRLYNPAQGRFLTGDPIGNFGDAANLGNGYTYVGNNPGSFTDPMGTFEADAFAAGIGWTLAEPFLIGADALNTAARGGYWLATGDAGSLAGQHFYSGGVNAAHQKEVVEGKGWLRGGAEIAGGVVAGGTGAATLYNIGDATYDYYTDQIGVDEYDRRLSEGAGSAVAIAGSVALGDAGGKARAANAAKAEALKRMGQGRDFDTSRAEAYPHREVTVERSNGRRARLDSYNPETGEIVSRKYSQLGDITEKTAKGYINEIPRKYPRGATISDVPSNGDLAGDQLRGRYILEVPEQNGSIPQSVLNYANKKGVRIRDITGRGY